jgi:hypothetical protein
MVSGKQSKDSDKEPPDMDVANVTSLIKDDSVHDTEPTNEIKVRPQEQQRISLGSFTATKPPKGFSVGFAPNPDPAGSVVTEITSLGSDSKYELVLHLANYGNKTVTAKVWQL